jgi:aldehyde dehydrogenase (NAD+)
MSAPPDIATNQRYVNGAWSPSTSTTTIDVIDSATELVMATVPAGSAEDADAAVRAARAAFPGWAATSPGERANFLLRLRDAVLARTDTLAEIITRETGMPVGLSRGVQVGLPLANLAQAADVVACYDFESTLGNSLIVREPIGVVACIAPWNYPLHQIVVKIAYAVAAGCTVVVKPSEVAPVDAFVLADITHDIGLPPGVFNLVCGTGPVVGEALASHPDVDMVSFTGSTRAGRRVAELAAGTIKKLALELGGKSANILLDDLTADEFAAAVTAGLAKAFLNSGQSCSAPTRLLVPAHRMAEAAAVAGAAADAMVLGDPFDPAVTLGPLSSAAARDRVLGYIRCGIDEGARPVAGGLGVPDGLNTGYFVRPTVFASVAPDMRIAQEEIFGPVLSVIGYADEDDAVRIANGVIYGLSGAVSSADPAWARRVALRLRTGQVDINGAAPNLAAPRGGYRQSGIGREFGRYGFEEFLELKSIQL